MDAFFYYSDLMAQARLAQTENTPEITRPDSVNSSWMACIAGYLSKLHHWLTEPIQAEAEEAFNEGRMPAYWGGF